jgi:hypothetical protein
MDSPEHLRVNAARMYVLARDVRAFQPAYAELLVGRADEMQQRATAMEEAAKPRPAADPQPAQLQEQIPPRKDEG